MPDSLYGSEYRTIFWVSWLQFEDMITKIMNEAELELYQDLRGRQGITSNCLKGMLFYPLKMLTFGIPYSAFVDYF